MKKTLTTALNFLLGTGINYLSSFVVLTVLLRFYPQEEYASFAVAQTVVFWLMPLVQMAMSITAVALLGQDRNETSVVRQVTQLRLTALAVVLLLQVVIGFYLKPTQTLMLWSFLPVLIANALMIEYLFIHRGEAKQLARTQVLGSALYMLGVVGALMLKLPIFAIPLINGLTLLLGVYWQWKLAKIHTTGTSPSALPATGTPRGTQTSNLLGSSITNTLSNFVQMGYYSIDLLLLASIGHQGPAVIAQYAAVTRLTQVAVMPMVALMNTLMPRIVAGVLQERQRAWRQYQWLCLAVGLLGCLGLAVLGAPVLGWISGKDTTFAHQLFPVFAGIFLLVALHSPYSTTLAYTRHEKHYFTCNLLAFVTNLLCCLLLIPTYGHLGAAFAQLFGVGALLVTSVIAHRLTWLRKEASFERT